MSEGIVEQNRDLTDAQVAANYAAGPAWIQYEFEKIYMLHEMSVWNFNGQSVLVLYGIKDVMVEYAIDGDNWMQIDGVTEFAQATGSSTYTYNTIVDFNDVGIKFVRITAGSNWNSTFFDQFGLSEVRFMKIPVVAEEPGPEDGATDVAIDVILGWRAGSNC